MIRRLTSPFRIAAAALWLGLIVAPDAHAQTASAIDRLDPAPAGDRFTAVPSPEVLGDLRSAAALTLVYADAPLALSQRSSNAQILELVDHQLVLHGQLSLELWHRFKAELALPMIISQGGEDADFATFRAAAPNGSAAGDLRLGARVELLRQAGLWPSAALSLSAWLPTGDSRNFAGAGAFRAAPGMVVGADYDVLAWSTHAAARIQPEADEGTLLGSELLFGAAIGPRVGPVRIAVEVFGTTLLDRHVAAATLSSTSVNGLLTATWERGPLHGRVGAGPGLSRGVGTPDWRVLGTIAYVPPAPSHEAREAAEARERAARGDHPQPSPSNTAPSDEAAALAAASQDDRDGDGVVDADDACPDQAGDPGGPRPGCPADADADTIADTADACPSIPGPPSADPAKHGCPRDRDGDGIIDSNDACPGEAGPKSEQADKNGCPTAVRVVGDQIVILQRVEFATGKAILAAQSATVLEQVAAVMSQHPEIARIGVDGHTDSVGRESANVALSQRRALAVVDWLVVHGVDARRLEARGFGPRQPIADNASKVGRQKNRRVEFNILRRTAEGEAGWIDGDLP
jgi:OmpA-OmpF porin, OOP family